MSPGDEIVCTITNEGEGFLKVKKTTSITNAGPGTQDFRFVWQEGAVTVRDEIIKIPSGDNMAMSGFISVIPATDYVITETEMPSGFSLTAIRCNIDPLGVNATTGTPNIALKQITGIEVRVGLDTVCIFNDEPNGTIKIIKDTEPDDTTLFDFTRSFGADFTLQDDGNEGANPSMIEFTGLLPGSFSVTELIDTDFVQLLSCT